MTRVDQRGERDWRMSGWRERLSPPAVLTILRTEKERGHSVLTFLRTQRERALFNDNSKDPLLGHLCPDNFEDKDFFFFFWETQVIFFIRKPRLMRGRYFCMLDPPDPTCISNFHQWTGILQYSWTTAPVQRRSTWKSSLRPPSCYQLLLGSAGLQSLGRVLVLAVQKLKWSWWQLRVWQWWWFSFLSFVRGYYFSVGGDGWVRWCLWDARGYMEGKGNKKKKSAKESVK